MIRERIATIRDRYGLDAGPKSERPPESEKTPELEKMASFLQPSLFDIALAS